MPVRMFKTTTKLIKEDAEAKLPSSDNVVAVHRPKTYKKLREQFEEMAHESPADDHQHQTEDTSDDVIKPFLTITAESYKDKNPSKTIHFECHCLDSVVEHNIMPS